MSVPSPLWGEGQDEGLLVATLQVVDHLLLERLPGSNRRQVILCQVEESLVGSSSQRVGPCKEIDRGLISRKETDVPPRVFRVRRVLAAAVRDLGAVGFVS